MNDQPTLHNARHQLETQRYPYNRDAVRATGTAIWGVYAIWAGPSECLYIGKSEKSIQERLLDHLSSHETNRLLKAQVRIARDHLEYSYCPTDTPNWAHRLEQRLIQYYRPECNIQGND